MRLEEALPGHAYPKIAEAKRRNGNCLKKLDHSMRCCDSPTRVMVDLFHIGLGDTDYVSELSTATGFNRFCSSGSYHLIVKSLACNLLFQLWCRRKLLLPYRFNFQRSIQASTRKNSQSEIARFLASFRSEGWQRSRYGAMIEMRMNSHCWVWLHTTSWINFSDISLDEVEILSSEMARRCRSTNEPNSPSSVSAFISVIVETFPSAVGFSTSDWDELSRSLKDKRNKKAAIAISLKHVSVDGDSTFVKMLKSPRDNGFFRLNPDLDGTAYCIGEADISRWNLLFFKYLKHRQEVKGYEDLKAVYSLYINLQTI